MRSCAIASVLTASAISLVFAASACGGGSSPGAQTPDNAASGASASSAAPPSSAGPTTTTTATLANNGDLQGAKLQSSSTTTVPATSSSAAPKCHRPEPGRSEQDLLAIVQGHRDEARACYDAALPSHPGMEGDLTIKWKIDPNGMATEVVLDTTRSQILEPSVGKCVSNVISKIKFAGSACGYETTAHYPFNFHPHRTSGSPSGQPQPSGPMQLGN